MDYRLSGEKFLLCTLNLFIKPSPKASVLDPILLEIVTGGVQTGLGSIEQDLPMIAHPNFTDGLDRDQGATQCFYALSESLDRTEVNTFKHIKISRANEMTAPNPGLYFFLSFWRKHAKTLSEGDWETFIHWWLIQVYT
jgi:hypothetical protein